MVRWINIILQSILGLVVLIVGYSKWFVPYIADNSDIMTFPDQFRLFYNAMNATGYLMKLVGSVQLIAGALLITRRYAYAGALLHLPVAINILAIHLFLDRFPDTFFLIGLIICVINIWLVWNGRERLALIFKRNLSS